MKELIATILMITIAATITISVAKTIRAQENNFIKTIIILSLGFVPSIAAATAILSMFTKMHVLATMTMIAITTAVTIATAITIENKELLQETKHVMTILALILIYAAAGAILVGILAYVTIGFEIANLLFVLVAILLYAVIGAGLVILFIGDVLLIS